MPCPLAFKIMVYNDGAQFLKSSGDSAAIEVKTIR